VLNAVAAMSGPAKYVEEMPLYGYSGPLSVVLASNSAGVEAAATKHYETTSISLAPEPHRKEFGILAVLPAVLMSWSPCEVVLLAAATEALHWSHRWEHPRNIW
jgi:hypothetical protein